MLHGVLLAKRELGSSALAQELQVVLPAAYVLLWLRRRSPS